MDPHMHNVSHEIIKARKFMQHKYITAPYYRFRCSRGWTLCQDEVYDWSSSFQLVILITMSYIVSFSINGCDGKNLVADP